MFINKECSPPCVCVCVHACLRACDYCMLLSYRLMMFRNVEELHQEANWPGVSGGSRQKLMEQLQSKSMSHSMYVLTQFTCVSQQETSVLALLSVVPCFISPSTIA